MNRINIKRGWGYIDRGKREWRPQVCIPALYDSVTTYIPLDAAWYFRAWVATRHDLGTYKEALEWWLVR